MDKLAAIDPKLVSTTNDDSFLFRDYFEIFVAQFIVGIAIICQPHIITKSLLLKSDDDVNKYLTTGIITQLIFFSVVSVGLYIRLSFPDLTIAGEALAMDDLVSAYVVREFPVFVGLIVVMGLISAGLSTLESLIQTLSTTVTKDILQPLAGNWLGMNGENNRSVAINKVVIVLMALATIIISWDQIVNPKLSVGIFAQNGVYAYFSAAFVPIMFGMFFKNVSLRAVFSASIVAVVVHFTMYYAMLPVPFTQSTGENPGVAAAVAITLSVLTVLMISFVEGKSIKTVDEVPTPKDQVQGR